MSNYSYFTDPGQELFLSQVGTQKQTQHSQLSGLVSRPGTDMALVAMSQLYPQASTELLLGAATAGINPNDPGLQEMVNLEIQNRPVNGPIEEAGGGWWDAITNTFDEAVTNPIQGAVRWGFSAWDAAWQMGAGGAIPRAMKTASDQNISFAEGFQQQDPFFFEALGGLFNNERVNLGSGWFPNSELTDSVSEQVNLGMQDLERSVQGQPAQDRYKNILTGSPDVWNQAITNDAQAQAELGKPLTQLHDVAAESVMFTLPGGQQTPWSTGRMVSANIVEPGTKPFYVISGMLDFTAQLALDPIDYVGGAWLKAGRNGRRIWGVSRKTSKAVDEGVAAADEALELGADATNELNRLQANTAPGMPEWAIHDVGIQAPQAKPIFTRVTPGQYQAETISQIDGTTRGFSIDKVNGKWHLTDEAGNPVAGRVDDPRYQAGSNEYPTLAAAREAADDFVGRTTPQPTPHMSTQEFIDSGEEIFVDGLGGVPKVDSGVGKVESGINPNAKIIVFGRKVSLLDIADDAGLTKADLNQLDGAIDATGTPAMEKLTAYMTENSIGKVDINGEQYVNPNFIGGNADDAVSQTFFDNPSGPMDQLDMGLETVDAPALRDLDPIFDMARRKLDADSDSAYNAMTEIDQQLKALREANTKMVREQGSHMLDDPEHIKNSERIKELSAESNWINENHMGGPRFDHTEDAARRAKSRIKLNKLDPRIRKAEMAIVEEKKGLQEQLQALMKERGYPERGVDEEVDALSAQLRELEMEHAHLWGEYYGGAPMGDAEPEAFGRMRRRIHGGTEPRPHDAIDKPRFQETLTTSGEKGIPEGISPGFEPIDAFPQESVSGVVWDFIEQNVLGNRLQARWFQDDAGRIQGILNERFVYTVARGGKRGSIYDVVDGKKVRISTEEFASRASEAAARGADEVGGTRLGDDVLETFDEDLGQQLGFDVSGTDKATAKRIVEVDNATPIKGPTYDGVRPDFDPDYELMGKKADMFVDKLVATTRAGGQTNGAAMDKLLRFMSKTGFPVPNSVRKRLFEAKSPEAVRSIFAEWLIKEGVNETILPGGWHFGRAAAAGVRPIESSVTDARWMKRQVARGLTGMDVNMVNDPSAAYNLYDKALPHFKAARGDSVKMYDDAGDVMLDAKGEARTIDVEDIFTELRDLRHGDKVKAFEIQGRFSQFLFSTIMEQGNDIDPRIAKRASHWFVDTAEKAVYDGEVRFGRTDLTNGAYDSTMISGELVGGLGPQLTADLWTGNLQPVNARLMKRVTAQTGLVGRISNRASGKWKVEDVNGVAIADFHTRASMRALDASIQKIWKPFVLLRAAWTLRILMDDQMRMAMEGYSMFNHPMRVFNYALTQPSDWKKAFTSGKLDVFGVKIDANNADAIIHGDFLKQALMQAHDPKLGPGAYGHLQHTRVGKTEKAYGDGLAFEVAHLRGSTLTQRLARSEADDPVDEAVKWLQGQGPADELEQAAAELSNQAHLHRKMGDASEKIMAGDYDTLLNIVERQWGLMHHRMGGKVAVDNAKGDLLNWGRLSERVGDGAPNASRAAIIVQEPGDPELLALIAGKTTIGDVNVGALKTEESRKALGQIMAKKAKQSDNFPDFVRVAKKNYESGAPDEDVMGSLNKTVGTLMDWAMTKPSNTWSRVPEFRRAYWRKIEELWPYMDEATREAIVKNMDGKLPTGFKPAKRSDDIAGQLTSVDAVDEQAKAFGMTMVEQTLFTLDSKTNIGDSLRLIMPFAEAWGEFISRWGRLAVYGDRNIKTLNTIRKGVTSARRSGFFHENEYGQEVFNYPAFMTKGQMKLHNVLNNLPMGEQLLGADVSDEVMDSIESVGYTESMNFASGVIPGFGPVFQQIARHLPDDPRYDELKNIVSPFGTEGGFIGSFAPAWVKRIVSANGGSSDPQLTDLWNSTVAGVVRTYIDNGRFEGLTTAQEINAVVKEAEGEAKGMLMVRAGDAFWAPSSPQYKFVKEDEDGLIWSYNALSSAFYDIRKEVGGDADEAMSVFFQRYGFSPIPFAQGKRYQVIPRSQTEQGSRYERSQSELFETYPSTAMFTDPYVDTSDYDPDTTLRQLKQGLREGYTGEQFMYIQQDMLGDIWMKRIKDQASGIPDSRQRDAVIAAGRAEIERTYPFWNVPVPGKRQSVNNETKMREVEAMLGDPNLAGNPAVEAAREYWGMREHLLRQIEKLGGSTISGPRSQNTEVGRVATRGRAWLRSQAQETTMKYPQFGPMFDNIFAWEVSEQRDAPTPDLSGQDELLSTLGIGNG